MSKIVIVKNIKEPSIKGNWGRSKGRNPEWPLHKLKIGDGFKLPIDDANKIRCAIQHHQRWYPGTKFRTAKDGEKLIVKRIA